MRNEIQANLEREASKRVNAKLKEQVMQALLDSTSIESPKVLVQLELERLTQDAHNELVSRGLGAKNLPLPQDLLKERAQRRVNLGLILGELVKTHNLHPKPEQVRAVVEDLAQVTKIRPRLSSGIIRPLNASATSSRLLWKTM